VTAWGVVPARGRLQFCGTCGSTITFGEKHRRGPAADAEAKRVTTAVQEHFRGSPSCQTGGTFGGREIAACRCERRIVVPREDGLFCARCEGQVAPQMAPVSQPGARTRGAR
jgi:hypothetical protein